jgi:glycosyltransferase involved in cell wall biosynthesis
MSNTFDTYDFLPKKKLARLSEGGLRFSKKKKPFFSIITVVFNGEKFLKETILSLANQTCKDYEYIIIDGGSNDSTLDIIKDNSHLIDYWISEKDKGLYDAFNKGMSVAQGHFIGIINSDDVYTQPALEIIKNTILDNSNIDFIFGSVQKHWGILHGYRPKKIYYSWGFYSSHSTGFFIKKESANKVGLYDLRYKYHADYDFFFRMIVKNRLKGIATRKDEVTGVFRRGGFSSKIPFRKLFFEELKIRYNNDQNLILIFIIFIHKFFKNIKKLLFNN